MSQPVSVTLTSPVEIGNDLIEVITLRRPKGKDLKTLSAQPNNGDLQKLAARLSGQLPVVFDEMDSYDLVNVLEAVGNFFTSAPETGVRS